MAYDVDRYLSIDAATAPAYTPAGRLLYLCDTTGTDQVWTADAAGAAPRRLTPHEERVTTLAASPTREEFAYATDAGGDERDQLFRYDLTDGSRHRLTDAPESKHAWGGWSPGGDRVAFTANRERAGRFDVFVQGRTDDDPERVATGDGGWLHVAAWGPAGDSLVLVEPNSSVDDDLYHLDLASGERTRLSTDDAATVSHVHATPDGEGLLAITNHGAEFDHLARIPLGGFDDPDPGALADAETLVADDWNVSGLAVDRETGRAAWTRNVDGYSTLSFGQVGPDGMSETTAPSVDGVATGLTFGPDGDRVAFAASENTRPYGVHVARFGTTDERRATDVGTNGLPPSAFRAAETVRYESFDGREIPAYWTLPGEAPEDETPVIVDIHGGPTHQRQPWFYPTKQFFLNRGYAVLEPNVRGSTGYGREYTGLDDVDNRMDSVRDVEQAVEWLRERPAVDEDRIVAYGRSYGGFMVLAAITEYPDLWAAAVEFVGIANFVTFLENTGEWRRAHREAEYGSLTEDRELLEAISPIHDVDRVSCPLFVQHGANDPRVPVEEARQVAETAREQGVPVETLVFEDEGHHTTTRANRIEEFEAIADFLDEHVRDS
jgi:dipeptidyl aminopeptidase/acylaminoacyl peptidase